WRRDGSGRTRGAPRRGLLLRLVLGEVEHADHLDGGPLPTSTFRVVVLAGDDAAEPRVALLHEGPRAARRDVVVEVAAVAHQEPLGKRAITALKLVDLDLDDLA